MTLLSVFGGGLWIIPLILQLGAGYSFYRAWKQSGDTDESIWKIPAFVFFAILQAAAIIVFFWIRSEGK